MKSGVIPKFTGEYAFLSNFYLDKFSWRGHEFRSAEHAFQWAKGLYLSDAYIGDMAGYSESILSAPTPAKAKSLGRAVRIEVQEWNDRRVQYMRSIVHAKFSGVPGLAGALINTGSAMLVEGNDHGDDFWGRCLDKSTGKMVGFNTLGTLLMEERGYWLHSNFNDKK